MCLAVPGQILSIDETDPVLRNARVSFSGMVKEVSLAMTPDAHVGQYVTVHAGLAISIVDEEEAAYILDALKQLDEAEHEGA